MSDKQITSPIAVSAPEKTIYGGGLHLPGIQLRIDEDGECRLSVSSWHNSENATTEDVWHKRAFEFRCTLSEGDRAIADPEKMADLAQTLQPLVDRLRAGHSVEIDLQRGEYVGKLTEDAEAAGFEIDQVLEDADWQSNKWEPWSVGDWLQDAPDELDVASSDADLEAMAKELEGQAENDGVALDGDLVERLQELRADLQWELQQGAAL